METIKIEIGFDLYKELTMLRETPDASYDHVIRKLMESRNNISESRDEKQPIKKRIQPIRPSSEDIRNGAGWYYQKVFFPEGTKFRAFHKGKKYEGQVYSGALSLNGKRFNSPSGAAVFVTGNSVNGWRFWECKRPNDITWRSIDSLRVHG